MRWPHAKRPELSGRSHWYLWFLWLQVPVFSPVSSEDFFLSQGDFMLTLLWGSQNVLVHAFLLGACVYSSEGLSASAPVRRHQAVFFMMWQKAFPPPADPERCGGGWTWLLFLGSCACCPCAPHHCEVGPILEVDCCHRAETGSDAGYTSPSSPAKAAWGVPSVSIMWAPQAPPFLEGGWGMLSRCLSKPSPLLGLLPSPYSWSHL